MRVKWRHTIAAAALLATATALVLLPSSKPGRIVARIVGKGQRMGDEAFLYFEVVNTTSRSHLLTFWSESRDGNEWKQWRTGPLSFTIAPDSTNKASVVGSAIGVRRVVLAFDPVRTNRLDKWLTRLKSYVGVKPKKPFTLYVEE